MPIPMDVKPTADELLDLLTTKARIPLAEVKQFPNGAVFEEPSSVVLPKMDGLGGAPRARQPADDARPGRA